MGLTTIPPVREVVPLSQGAAKVLSLRVFHDQFFHEEFLQSTPCSYLVVGGFSFDQFPWEGLVNLSFSTHEGHSIACDL